MLAANVAIFLFQQEKTSGSDSSANTWPHYQVANEPGERTANGPDIVNSTNNANFKTTGYKKEGFFFFF